MEETQFCHDGYYCKGNQVAGGAIMVNKHTNDSKYLDVATKVINYVEVIQQQNGDERFLNHE
jgi:hypothetical protein